MPSWPVAGVFTVPQRSALAGRFRLVGENTNQRQVWSFLAELPKKKPLVLKCIITITKTRGSLFYPGCKSFFF
jgi:hypothetical protein